MFLLLEKLSGGLAIPISDKAMLFISITEQYNTK